LSTFSNLGLSNPLIDVLNNLGFTTPTPVQEQAIPLLLSDTPIDFIGLAQTGTGKTAAFGLPLIDLIDSDNRLTTDGFKLWCWHLLENWCNKQQSKLLNSLKV